MHDNFNDELKEHLKIEDKKRKKAGMVTLIFMRKNNRGNMRKKGRKLWMITLIMNKKKI